MQPLRIPPPFDIPADPTAPPRPPAASPGGGGRVWLVRHAEVHGDWHHRAYGGLDVPLSERGEADTRAVAASFAGAPLARVASSHLVRARTLGEAIARESGAPLHVDERLREISRGAWQGLPAAEFRARWEADRERFLADPWTWKGHGGESDADVAARAWPALAEHAEAARGRELAVAAHYNVIRVLVTRALGLGSRESFTFQSLPAHATCLVAEDGGWRLLAANLPAWSAEIAPAADAPPAKAPIG